MRNRLSLIIPALATVTACVTPVNTVPAPVTPDTAIQYYDLEVPQDLEVKSVGFSATTFAQVSGNADATSSAVGGRAFVQVYAVHRTTGEHFLLLYEDVTHRRRPVEVIRFVRGSNPARPDSTGH
jgi:hypothetical protein